MAKTINFNYEGQHYVLEFSRRTVRQMENNGFTLNDLSDKPMNTLNELFAGAFKKNHRNVKPEQIDKMQALFAEYPEVDLGALGFPSGNWQEEPLWSTI